MKRVSRLPITAGLLLVVMLSAAWPSRATADIATGLQWLQARDSATGVHRPDDLANAADTNAETYITAAALSSTADFPGTLAAARQSVTRRCSRWPASSTTVLRRPIGHRRPDRPARRTGADGGFPPLPGLQSEALTTAWALRALDRAGRGGQTEAARALGYLTAAQQADGGWLAAIGNTSHVVVSAEVARVLHDYRNRYVLTQPIGRVLAHLLQARLPNDTFGEVFETAYALEALVALGVDRVSLAPVAVALAGSQSADGSFQNDAFVTSIALRALWKFEQPVIDPQQAGITGRVLAADTGLFISGATLALTGVSTAALVSNDFGRHHSNTLTAGPYNARLTYAGMRPIEFQVNLVDGRTLDLGDLRMYQGDDGSNPASCAASSPRPKPARLVAGARVFIETPPMEVTTGTTAVTRSCRFLPAMSASASPQPDIRAGMARPTWSRGDPEFRPSCTRNPRQPVRRSAERSCTA